MSEEDLQCTQFRLHLPVSSHAIHFGNAIVVDMFTPGFSQGRTMHYSRSLADSRKRFHAFGGNPGVPLTRCILKVFEKRKKDPAFRMERGVSA